MPTQQLHLKSSMAQQELARQIAARLRLKAEGKAKNFLARFLRNDAKGTAHRRG